MESYIKMWTNYFNFKDRTTRKDYWLTVVINILIGAIISFISGFIIKVTGYHIFDYIMLIYYLLTFIPALAQSVRRMHDVNKSGWYLLMSLIPIVGWIIVLVQECSPSVDVNNNYGTKL